MEVSEEGAVAGAAETLHGGHHAEIIVFTRDTDGPGAIGVATTRSV